MVFTALLLAFLAGLACGLALRPGIDRRRQLQRAYALARARRGAATAGPLEAGEGVFVPRDYYLADRRERGTLAEGFGLRSVQSTAGDTQAEFDFSSVPMPRDYYERDTPEDGGTLAEDYGLRGFRNKDAGTA